MPWLIALLLGFVPASGPPPGPPVPHLGRTPHLQARWSGEAAWFRERHGAWAVRWDERNRTPRALLGPGTLESHASTLAADVARLAGVDPGALQRGERRTIGARSATRFHQTWHGAPVVDGGVDVVAQHGRVHLIWARLHRPALAETPRPGELVLPVDRAGRLTYHLVTRSDVGDDVVYTDRAGTEVLRYTTRRHLDLELPERTVGDPLVVVPARQVTVTDADGDALTDDAGVHDRVAPLDVRLVGPFLDVRVAEETVGVEGVEDGLLVAGEDLPVAAATVQHHTHLVRDWLALRQPEHAWLPSLVPANVNVDGQCNAFYTRGTINFLSAGGPCEDFGVIADVIFHEYGHGVHDRGLIAGSFAGDVSEGSADFVSATLLNDARVGLGAYGPDTLIRDLAPDRVWPFDAVGQVHNDGLIWGSFLWNLREQWIAEHGYDDGVRRTDELFLDALALGPGLTDLYEAVLAADDDDGDLSNGTPHACELTELLDAHGIGPGPVGYIALAHAPPADQPTTKEDLTVTWSLTDVTADCSRFDADRTRLWVAQDPDVSEPDAVAWAEVVPTRTGDVYSAVLPARPAGSHTVYHLSWASDTGEYPHTSHGGVAADLYDLWWGDTAPLWCDDFESGQGAWLFGTGLLDDAETDDAWESEWAVGGAAEGPWTPDVPGAGSAFLGTNLDDDGQYRNDNAQYALSPIVTLGAAHPAVLRFEAWRWLTVEKSRFDVAAMHTLSSEGELAELWRNPFGADLLDREWTRWRIDLRHLPADGTDAVHLAWTLGTDQGLEYGGWHLDDVCVVTLDAPERHYRVDDLRVTDGGDAVVVTWSDPWVTPLVETVLVRKHGAPPSSRADGDVLGVFAGVPGEVRTYRDTDAGAFRRWDWHYAVFATGPTTAWDDAVVGENAGGIVREAEPASTVPPTGGVSADPAPRNAEAPSGCGCNTGAAPWSGLWLLALVGLRRR